MTTPAGPGAGLVVRQPRASEAAHLTALALRSKAHWGYSAEFIAACREELGCRPEQFHEAGRYFRVAELGGTVAGFYSLEQTSGEEMELDALFVDPAFIGKGIGRALLAHAVAEARRQGAERLVVQSDPHAEKFYLRAGAVRTGVRESGSIPGRFLPVLTIPLTGDTGVVAERAGVPQNDPS